jgi:hypothetical protein
MKYSMCAWKRVLAACFVFVLIASGLRGQTIPPDTTHYLITNWAGQQEWVQRPPDSLMIPGVIVLHFRRWTLDSSILSHTYWDYFYGHNAKQKGVEPLSGGGPYSGVDQPRGFYSALRQELFADRFWFDSTNNIVKDTSLRNFLIAGNCYWLRRLTAASPLDTLSVTRTGDTIGCDLPYMMVMSVDSIYTPTQLLQLCYALEFEFPNDIAEAYPDYRMGQLMGHPASDIFLTQGCERNIDLIHADTAWNYEVGDTGVSVAALEWGIFYPHPDFGGDYETGPGHKFTARWNFAWGNDSVDNLDSTYLAVTDDHGTAMCGIIGALTNNPVGFLPPHDSSVAGIAGGHGPQKPDTENLGRGVSLLALIWNGPEGGTFETWAPAMFEAAAKSPVTAFGYGANIINNSIGFQWNTPYTIEAVNYAYDNAAVVVAAKGEQATGDTIDRVYPADSPDPWVLSVGGSVVEYPAYTLPMKIQQSDFGYDMDIIAPAGSTDPCGGWDLNYTTGKVFQAAPPSYEPYAGTSAACANASGAVALLVSVDHRLDSATLRGMEPEDYQGIIKAGAWRGDPGRMSDPSKTNSWVDSSGYGHLDIGNVFKMRDTSYARGGYFLTHYSATGTKLLKDTGAWYPGDGSKFQVFFQSPWDPDGGVGIGDTFQRFHALLPDAGLNGYMVRRRVITWVDTVPKNYENSDTCPLFVWGRSGGPPPASQGDTAAQVKSGWDFSTSPNYENGWSQVVNGMGGDRFLLEDGIFAPTNGIINIRTVQYDVWGYNNSTRTYSNYLGHFPTDSNLGVNWTVYGRKLKPASSVQEASNSSRDNSISVTVDPDGNMLTARYYTSGTLHNTRIELDDVLGRTIAQRAIGFANSGWNTADVSTSSLSPGTYFCYVTADGYSCVKSFVLLK